MGDMRGQKPLFSMPGRLGRAEVYLVIYSV